MVKLIIADDDEFIRQQLVEIVADSGLEFDIVGAFSDGAGVIDYLKENPADIILTDIKMKNKTGLDIAEYVYQNSPNTIVILVSGHQEFSYAKKAIHFGVSDYLVKPTSYSDLIGTLEAASKKISARKLAAHFMLITMSVPESFGQEFLEEINGFIEKIDSYVFYALIKKNSCKAEILSMCDITSQMVKDATEQKIIHGDEVFSKKVRSDMALLKKELSGYFSFPVNIEFGDILENKDELVTNYFREQEALFDYESDDEIIIKAIKYIKDNYRRDISLEEVATYVNLSVAYFSRYFKQNTGKRFIDYVVAHRIEMAKRMLKDKNTKISDIYEMVGYNNIRHFLRSFKDATGNTPSEYRSNTRDEK